MAFDRRYLAARRHIDLHGIPEDDLRKLETKDQVRRFARSLLILDQMLQEGPKLIDGDMEKRELEWRLCLESVLDLWNASVCLWKCGHYASANALAISTLEETGKLTVESYRLRGVERIPISEGNRSRLLEQWTLRRKPFLDHLTKATLAALSGAVINSRLDRILGERFVVEFLSLTERGGLESLRQACLYLDQRGGALIRPQDVISIDEASRYVALAGEVLAEILSETTEWKMVLDLVIEFEKIAGLPHE